MNDNPMGRETNKTHGTNFMNENKHLYGWMKQYLTSCMLVWDDNGFAITFLRHFEGPSCAGKFPHWYKLTIFSYFDDATSCCLRTAPPFKF